MRTRKTRLIPWLLVLTAAVLFLRAGLDNRLTVTEYTIQSNKIETDIKVVLLADLHSCSYGADQHELIKAIDSQEPDMILMAGDIADDDLPDKKTKELLAGIADKYPCYYVTGNHEFLSGRVETQKDMFRSYGVTVLAGDCETINLNGQSITVGGVDDPKGGKKKFESQLSVVADEMLAGQYNILLSHRPEHFKKYAAYQFDLVVSGHAHGGQWRLPWIMENGLLAPDQGLFPEYTKGVHAEENTRMVVSRGLSRESTRIPRFFNPPEIVVINLTGAGHESE